MGLIRLINGAGGNRRRSYLARRKPADLPVQQATKVELIINLKTAAVHESAVGTLLLSRDAQSTSAYLGTSDANRLKFAELRVVPQ
jgi:hypothetical protein